MGFGQKFSNWTQKMGQKYNDTKQKFGEKVKDVANKVNQASNQVAGAMAEGAKMLDTIGSKKLVGDIPMAGTVINELKGGLSAAQGLNNSVMKMSGSRLSQDQRDHNAGKQNLNGLEKFDRKFQAVADKFV